MGAPAPPEHALAQLNRRHCRPPHDARTPTRSRSGSQHRQDKVSVASSPYLQRVSGNDGELVDEASRLIIAGANVASSSTSLTRPARASRRQVNNWLAYHPFRRAVSDITRVPL